MLLPEVRKIIFSYNKVGTYIIQSGISNITDKRLYLITNTVFKWTLITDSLLSPTFKSTTYYGPAGTTYHQYIKNFRLLKYFQMSTFEIESILTN